MNEIEIWDACIGKAKESLLTDDVPIGAVLIQDGKIIASGCNTRERDKSILGHAEINTIAEASRALGRWNLADCTLYVTLKPCSMCQEVIKQSRISKVYYLLDKLAYKKEYNKTNICMHSEAIDKEYELMYNNILKDFFKDKRK